MDAMQKKKMWKVAAIHLLLSLLAIFGVFYFFFFLGDFLYLPVTFWSKMCMWLQPFFCQLFFFFLKADAENLEISLLIQIPLYLFCILIWSFCVGWLYTKLVSLLNRDSILGRKVFSNRKSQIINRKFLCKSLHF